MSKRILHLASFAGNLGDVANHRGFYRKLKEQLGEVNFEVSKVEIRDFYFNSKKRAYNTAFVDEINKHDLLVVGGGGFFNCYWPESATGCTLDWSPEFLSAIRVPIVVNAMGVDLHQGEYPEAIAKFKAFIEALLNRENTMVSIRNDGSRALLERMRIDIAPIYFIPDFAFYALEWKPNKQKGLTIINLAGDVIQSRYTGVERSAVLQSLAQLIVDLHKRDPERDFYLIPHIAIDLFELVDLWRELQGRVKPAHVCIPQFSPDEKWLGSIFDLYQGADIVIGMRFHSNVLGLSVGASTFGLNTYFKVGALFDELGLSENVFHINNPTELERLRQIGEYNVVRQINRTVLEEQTNSFLGKLKDFLTR